MLIRSNDARFRYIKFGEAYLVKTLVQQLNETNISLKTY